MSDIVLSASVRQNLLSLQSTAELLATTQNRLATGKKVNSALDNPTNFFTAAGLDARASDINNLLDGIGNGVQVLQAANTGITSLQKLIDSAKSIANQALQSQVGYTKSVATTAPNPGANGSNILGSGGVATNASVSGANAITSVDLTAPAQTAKNAVATGTIDLSGGIADPGAGTDITFTINGKTVTLTGGSGSDAVGNNFTLDDIKTAINNTVGVGVVASDDGAGGHLILTSDGTAGAADNIVTLGTAAAGLGIADTTVNGSDAVPHADLTFDVNGHPVTLAGGSSYSGTQIASAIQSQVGSSAGVSASYSTGKLVITSTGTAGAADAVTVGNFSSGTAAQLGFPGATANGAGTDAGVGLTGQTLTIQPASGGTATSIVFGTAVGEVSTINQLNAALLSNNLQASIDTTGAITITTANDAASSTIGAFGGTATNPGNLFAGLTPTIPAVESNSQATRANLVSQYNNIIQQIKTTSQDASFNGVNLLNGDQLKLVFNETGKSTLNITGINLDPAGLGLGNLIPGTDFIDNVATNKVLDALNYASSFLRSQASTLGSNLSIVQIRQDFSKNIINVLQSGSANLTIADTNEEAANSQALATRQSIAVSALALANQSQQSVLKLLQ